MKTIWKYTLCIEDFQEIEMPLDAKILTAQTQKDDLQLWASVNPNNSRHTRIIRIIGTGHLIEEDEFNDASYIDTFQVFGGSLIFHVFDYGYKITRPEN